MQSKSERMIPICKAALVFMLLCSIGVRGLGVSSDALNILLMNLVVALLGLLSILKGVTNKHLPRSKADIGFGSVALAVGLIYGFMGFFSNS